MTAAGTKKFDYPWDITRAGDRFLLTEKAGNVVLIENGRLRRYVLQTSDAIVSERGFDRHALPAHVARGMAFH